MNFELVYREECDRTAKAYFDMFDLLLKQGAVFSQSTLQELTEILDKHSLEEGLFGEIQKRIECLKTRAENIEEDSELKKRYEALLYSISLRDAEITEAVLPNDILDVIDTCDLSEQDTLVGALREPRQFGIALKRKFYHIPAVYIEEYAIPKYIALYQSQKMFGEEISGVKYYGEVKKCTPMRRSKIREIPKNSNEIYYKFKIKKWMRLEKTVNSKEIGFVRLFTNSALLQNVEDVSALTIKDSYEFRLYKLLKAASSLLDGESLASHFIMDGFDFVFTKQMIYLFVEGEIAQRYWHSSLDQTPSRLLQKIKKDIATLVDNLDNIEDKEKNYAIQNI